MTPPLMLLTSLSLQGRSSRTDSFLSNGPATAAISTSEGRVSGGDFFSEASASARGTITESLARRVRQRSARGSYSRSTPSDGSAGSCKFRYEMTLLSILPPTSHSLSSLFFCFSVSARFPPSGSLALSRSVSHTFFFFFKSKKSATVTTVVSNQPGDSRRLTSELFVHRWDTNIYPFRVRLGPREPPCHERNTPAWAWTTPENKHNSASFCLFPPLRQTHRYTSTCGRVTKAESCRHPQLSRCAPWREFCRFMPIRIRDSLKNKHLIMRANPLWVDYLK